MLKYSDNNNKQIHKPALILMLTGLFFAFVMPLIAYICCIISIVMCLKNRKKFNTNLTLVFSLIGLAITIAHHVYSALNLLEKM